MIINFKTFINENLLVPRNVEGRKEKLKQMNIKLLSQEVIDGDIEFDYSFMDIDPKLVKLKKVNGTVFLDGMWTEIPAWLKDVEISEDFDCSFNKLTTLKNCPQHIEGSIICNNNELTSLEGCPKIVEENFRCYNNRLASLEGCPKEIGGALTCKNNTVKLTLPYYIKLKGEFKN